MGLINFSEIKKLSEYSLNDKDGSIILSEISHLLHDKDSLTKYIAKNNEKVNLLIEKGKLKITGDSQIEFEDKLHFEFFYSFKFVTEHFTNEKSFCNFVDIIWEKIYRSKILSFRASQDFSAICLLNIHNYFGFDILKIAENIEDTCLQQVTYNLDKALPYLSLMPENVHEFIKCVLARDQENFIPSFANALSGLSVHQPETAIELLKLIDAQNEERIAAFVPPILIGLTNSKGSKFTIPILISMFRSNIEYKVKNSLFVLSRINLDNEDWRNFGTEINEQLTLLENNSPEAINALLPEVYVQHISNIPSADKFLLQYSISKNQQIQHAVADILWLRNEKIENNPIYETMILNSASWDFSNQSIIQSVKSCFYHLAEKNPALSIKFLNAWIENKNNPVDRLSVFSNSIMTIYSKDKELIEDWITLSFRSENKRFHLAMKTVISDFWVSDIRTFALSKKLIDKFSYQEIKYILFKILAFIHSKEPLESLAYSILQKEAFDYRIANLVATAFTRYICYNYGGSYKYLKHCAKTATDEQKEVIITITDALDEYHKHLKAVPNINELKWQNNYGVSFVERNMKKMSKDLLEGMDKNKEHSIRSLFTNVSLKGGKKFFSKHDGQYSSPAELQNFGSSLELPAGEFIDPLREILNRIEWYNYKIES